MSIAVSEIRRRQMRFKKKTLKADNIIFGSDFGKNACSRVENLTRKYTTETPFLHRKKKITIRIEGNSNRIIAWAIAERVREARERQGLRQEDLAEKTGIVRSNIARLERGRHLPTLPTLQKIARALSLNINNLVAQPMVTQKDRLEFKEMAKIGLDEWTKQLEAEDAKD